MRAASDINLSWLVRLRWFAIAGQLTTIVVVRERFAIDLPLTPLAAILGVEAASNLVAMIFARSRRPKREAHIAALLAFDIITLTALLGFTGGPYNPFSFLYLVYIALAAVVLRTAWTWSLAIVSLACFGALFIGNTPLPMDHARHLRTHVEGMWAAFGVAAAFIVYFVTRITRELAQREAELARGSRLVSLATLAAGAAHELSTPLATIAIAAKELDRRLLRLGESDAKEDACLIRSEVERCRTILEQMAADAGHASGAAHATVTIGELVAVATGERPVEVVLSDDDSLRVVQVPLRTLARALRGLVKNAVDAAGDAVAVRCAIDHGVLCFEVDDRGPGMPADVLARAGEPFFTTKEPGQGMGLGLFLARSVLERLGGALVLESRLGQGTRAVATIPLAQAS